MITDTDEIDRCSTTDDEERDEDEEASQHKTYIDDEEDFAQGPGERWDPLGADDDENSMIGDTARPRAYDNIAADREQCGGLDSNRIRSLEEEQEMLTTSLMALTSHFAQVQFRLRQIVDAPATQRDQLLKNLEEFAFRGIPEVAVGTTINQPESDEALANLDRARTRQFELIERLKRQLTELEKFAYESGAPVLPQSIIVEKQKIIIDELKNKLNLNVNDSDLPQLTSEDIKSQVDTALGEFVGPLKMKEQLVAQLKTQITDLERFIAFLQHSENPASQTNDAKFETPMPSVAYNSYSAKTKNVRIASRNSDNVVTSQSTTRQSNRGPVKTVPNESTSDNGETFTNKTHSLLSKASTLLQMFAVAQFGCGSSTNANEHFRKNTLKKSARINHWGDTRAQLEVDIQEVAALALTIQQDRDKHHQQQQQQLGQLHPEPYETYVSDSDDEDTRFICSQKPKQLSSRGGTGGDLYPLSANFSMTNVELTTVVRKNLSVTLQKLIQHGLRSDTALPGSSLVPFIGCFHVSSQLRRSVREPAGLADDYDSTPSSMYDEYSGQMHAWQLILQYYTIKNGAHYNETPSRKLSQSFNLDIVGGTTANVSNKQSLLSVIGSIIAMHKPYKRSYNSHFKAFVCAGLNARKLVAWLNLIFQCNELINTYYMNWSYVAQTGFRDALHSLDPLTKYEFDLPVDLAVRQFQNIKDVFM